MSFQSAAVCLDFSMNVSGWHIEQRSWISATALNVVVDAGAGPLKLVVGGGVALGIPEEHAVAIMINVNNDISTITNRFSTIPPYDC
jgi:hypothetical protein